MVEDYVGVGAGGVDAGAVGQADGARQDGSRMFPNNGAAGHGAGTKASIREHDMRAAQLPVLPARQPPAVAVQVLAAGNEGLVGAAGVQQPQMAQHQEPQAAPQRGEPNTSHKAPVPGSAPQQNQQPQPISTTNTGLGGAPGPAIAGGGVSAVMGALLQRSSADAAARVDGTCKLRASCLECLLHWGVSHSEAVTAVGVLYRLSADQQLQLCMEGLEHAQLLAAAPGAGGVG